MSWKLAQIVNLAAEYFGSDDKSGDATRFVTFAKEYFAGKGNAQPIVGLLKRHGLLGVNEEESSDGLVDFIIHPEKLFQYDGPVVTPIEFSPAIKNRARDYVVWTALNCIIKSDNENVTRFQNDIKALTARGEFAVYFGSHAVKLQGMEEKYSDAVHYERGFRNIYDQVRGSAYGRVMSVFLAFALLELLATMLMGEKNAWKRRGLLIISSLAIAAMVYDVYRREGPPAARIVKTAHAARLAVEKPLKELRGSLQAAWEKMQKELAATDPVVENEQAQHTTTAVRVLAHHGASGSPVNPTKPAATATTSTAAASPTNPITAVVTSAPPKPHQS